MSNREWLIDGLNNNSYEVIELLFTITGSCFSDEGNTCAICLYDKICKGIPHMNGCSNLGHVGNGIIKWLDSDHDEWENPCEIYRGNETQKLIYAGLAYEQIAWEVSGDENE